jgi:hypothetical protein
VDLLQRQPTPGQVHLLVRVPPPVLHLRHTQRSPLTKRVDVRALPRETHGTKDNASDPLVPASLKQYMIENFKVWQGDQLVTRMEELRSMLYTNRASTAIVSCRVRARV